jgi:hypothetical protein
VNTRTKGRRFEREVADELEGVGLTVRGLESGGDHLVVVAGGQAWHVEAKRQERMQLPAWLRQQDEDCPPGARRVLVFRQSRQPSYAVEPFEQFTGTLATLSRLAEYRAHLAAAIAQPGREQLGDYGKAYTEGLRAAASILDETLGTP